MSLLKVWKERKDVSPHRPKRARTGWLVVAFVLAVVAFWMLGGFA